MFNTKFLHSKGYGQEVLDSVIYDIGTVPFDEEHQALSKFAMKAIYESLKCKQSDFNTLYEMGWNQKDVFDAIEHAGTIFRNGRILTAYAVKG